MHLAKVLLINLLLALILLYTSVSIYSYYLKKTTSSITREHMMYSADAEIISEYGADILKPVPSRYLIHQKPELKDITIADHNEAIKYPRFYKEQAFEGNVKLTAKAQAKDKLIYQIEYDFDQYGRRRIDNSPKPNAKNFVLSFGCSITMGEGVQKGMDYPSQLNEALGPDWSVYNFGFHGFSPAFTFYRAQQFPQYLQGIKEDSGVLVWVFIPNHLNREFCPISCYNKSNNWILNSPEVEKQNGEFKYIGDYRQSATIWRMLMYISTFMPFLNNLEYPETYFSDDQYDHFFDLISEIGKMTGKKITKKYLLVYDVYDKKMKNQIDEKSKKYNFEVMYFQKLQNRVPEDQLVIWGDTHPAPATYWFMSQMLKAKIVQQSTKP